MASCIVLLGLLVILITGRTDKENTIADNDEGDSSVTASFNNRILSSLYNRSIKSNISPSKAALIIFTQTPVVLNSNSSLLNYTISQHSIRDEMQLINSISIKFPNKTANVNMSTESDNTKYINKTKQKNITDTPLNTTHEIVEESYHNHKEQIQSNYSIYTNDTNNITEESKSEEQSKNKQNKTDDKQRQNQLGKYISIAFKYVYQSMVTLCYDLVQFVIIVGAYQYSYIRTKISNQIIAQITFIVVYALTLKMVLNIIANIVITKHEKAEYCVKDAQLLDSIYSVCNYIGAH